MFCSRCGKELTENHQFCTQCGLKVGEAPPPPPPRPQPRLVRPMREKQIGGVCAGFARYFRIDVTLVRLLWLCTVIFWGTGFLAYIICWIVIPRDYGTDTGNVTA